MLERIATVALIHQAINNGARLSRACEEAELSLRTYRRWYRVVLVGMDQRPLASWWVPVNKISEQVTQEIFAVSNEPQCASLPPSQLVPKLLVEGI